MLSSERKIKQNLLRLTSCAIVLFSLASCANQTKQNVITHAAEQPAPPNILLILSDDHAWNDYSFMGHEIVNTPSLDSLANEGVTFSKGYVPTSLCRPSLATIATGLYASQHGITGNDPSRETPGGKKGKEYQQLRSQIIAKIDEVKTLPELLREKGYASLQTGKWWEGSYERGGFDEGMTKGFPNPGGRHGDEGLKIGREGVDTITRFIDKTHEANKPFFVWYAPFLPHTPHNPPKALLDKYRRSDTPERLAKYYAMCEWFDQTCGKLLDRLEQKGVADNTIVIYVFPFYITCPSFVTTKSRHQFIGNSIVSISLGLSVINIFLNKCNHQITSITLSFLQTTNPFVLTRCRIPNKVTALTVKIIIVFR